MTDANATESLATRTDRTFNAMRARWQELNLQTTDLPLKEDVILWQGPGRTIFVRREFGPPIPYPAIPRGSELESNHGYARVKGDLGLIDLIPEVKGWPEYAGFLRVLNGDTSPVESVGCAVGLWPNDEGNAKHRIGSYVDIIFTDTQKAEDLDSHLQGAAIVMEALDGCEAWWVTAEIGLQRLVHVPGVERPLGLMMRLSAYGLTQEGARQALAVALERVAAVVPDLGRAS